MEKSTNFTTKKLSIILATAVAGQLLLSVPAQASATTSGGTVVTSTSGEKGSLYSSPLWSQFVQWLKDCFKDEKIVQEEIKKFKASCTSKECQEVPEPLTILGVGATLAALPAFKKRYAELKKEQ